MIITDSSKLFLRTSSLVWRMLPYMLISLLVICGLAIAICYPLIEELSQAGFFTQLLDLFRQIFFNLRIDEILASASNLALNLFDIITQNMSIILPLVIVALVIFSLGSFLVLGLSELAIADCLYGYMSSNSRLSFYSCFIKNLKKSFKLQLSKLLIVLPVDLIITAIIIGSLMLFTINNAIVITLAPFIIILVLCLLIALRQTLFCMWSPCMIVRNNSVWGALKESWICMASNFGTIYSRQLVVTIFSIGINIATCIFTASVGLFLTIPATVLFSNILGQTCFFYINGLKFYVDEDEIRAPKKREDWEHLSSIKDII